MTNSKQYLDLETFEETLIMLFDEYSKEKIEHWDKFGREHPNFESCTQFHAGNFDGFMLWLVGRSMDRGKTEARATGDSSERMDSPEERQPVPRN